MRDEREIIEELACPCCRANPGEHCRNIRRNTTRIWPFSAGSSSDTWVHKERRELAISRGALERTPGE